MATDNTYDPAMVETASSGKLRFLTMNCWGLRLISKYRQERLSAIARELIGKYDIVALQEVWSKEDFAMMKGIVRNDLPYSHMFYSGVIGSGLCVFSRHPIVGSHFQQFMSSGGVFDLHKGDVFAGKGVGMCRIQLPLEGCYLSVYTSHTYSRFRESQMFQFAQFVHNTRGNDLVVACGDLNTYAGQIALKLFTKCLQLEDSFYHGDCSPAECSMCKTSLHTCDNRGNVFVKKTSHPKRIDYLFFSPASSSGYTLTDKSYCLVMDGFIPGQEYNYSDHVGLRVELTLARSLLSTAGEPPGELSICDTEEKQAVLHEIHDIIQRKKSELKDINPLVTIPGIRKWLLWHLAYFIATLLLLSLVPPPFTILTNFLWALLVCYWLRTFIAHLVSIGHLAGVENNLQDLNNYLGRNGLSLPANKIGTCYSHHSESGEFSVQ